MPSRYATPWVVLAAIRDVLAGHRVEPPEIAGKAGERRHQADLTSREHEVLTLLVHGLSNKDIASRLDLGETTIKTHVAHILEKLGAEDRTQAAIAAVKRGIVSPF